MSSGLDRAHAASSPAPSAPIDSLHGTPVRRNVLLDIGPAVHQRAGLSRYAHALATHLLQLAPNDLDLAFFYNRHSGHRPPTPLDRAPSITVPLNQHAWRMSALAGHLLRSSLPNIDAQAHQQLGRSPDLYHATEHLLPRMSIPAVMTVHDLIFEWLPEYHTRLNRLFLRMAMPRFLAAATAIIAVSAHTAHDIVARYHIDTAKIHVIHEGVDESFQPASPESVARVRKTYAQDAPYLLMVGTLEPRKNHALALHALHKLHAEGHPHRLLIAGGKGWLFDQVQELIAHLNLVDAVTLTGYVPGADLPALYSGADCVLVPSLYEGFGFPVLEAMACGAPVVSSNVSSLPEIAGDAALLVSPHDAEELARAVGEILSRPDLAQSLRRRGLARARQFRWEDCAAATVHLYRHTLESTARL